MKIAKIVFGLCTGALLLSGCMTEELVKQRAADERIELIGSFSFDIELISAKTFVNDDGLLTVDAKALLSRTSSFRWFFCGDPNVTVWYHFSWLDAQGNIYPPIQREMVALPGNILDFHGVAPEEKYINYRLTVSLKGPATNEETDKQSKKAKSSTVKPAGKSEAAIVKKNVEPAAKPAKKAEVKTEAKPAAKKAEPKKAEAKPAAKKAEPKKAEAKPAAKKAEPQKAEAKPAAGKASKQQKLTEPFD